MLLPHAEAVLSCSLLDRDDLLNKASILHNLSWYLWLKGDYWLSKLKIDQAVEIRRDHLATKDSALLASMGLCATVLSSQGRYEEAERMHRQTLELSEKVLGLEHPSTLTSVWCLASVLHSRRQYQNSNILYQRACAGYQKILGLEHPNSLSCLKQHASLLEDMKRQNQE
jgi:tetratricopeptide (TPR) repeat protein